MLWICGQPSQFDVHAMCSPTTPPVPVAPPACAGPVPPEESARIADLYRRVATAPAIVLSHTERHHLRSFKVHGTLIGQLSWACLSA